MTQLVLDAVKMPDLQQDKSGVLRGVGLGFKKLAAHMGPAGGQADVLPGAGKGRIRRVAITLDDAGKGGRDNVIKARRRPDGFPVEKGVAANPSKNPRISPASTSGSSFPEVIHYRQNRRVHST